MFGVIAFAAAVCAVVHAQEDNAVIDDPELICGGDRIGLRFKTARPFNGHVFIKEHFVDPACRYTADTVAERKNASAELFVGFDQCGVHKRRTVSSAVAVPAKE